MSDLTPLNCTTSKKHPGFIERAITSLLMRSTTVSSVRSLSPNFRLIELQGDSLKGVEFAPEQKIQIVISSPLVARTYTPIKVNRDKGVLQFLAYTRNDGPGSLWAANLNEGDECKVFGPRSSLGPIDITQPLVLFGDETSFGLAAGLQWRTGLSEEINCVFEVQVLEEAEHVLARLGLDPLALVQRRADDAHLNEIMPILSDVTKVSTHFILTGRGKSIQHVHRQLKAYGIRTRRLQNKAYWSEGKTGFD